MKKYVWLAAVLVLAVPLTKGWWAPLIGRSLVCDDRSGKSDVVLLVNFDPNFALFQRAASIRHQDAGQRVIALVEASKTDSSQPDEVSKGIAELMARLAGVSDLELLPTRYAEPITLTSAYAFKTTFVPQGVKSVTIVSPAFRSYRDELIYNKVMAPAQVRVLCNPVFDGPNPTNWLQSMHGIQEVALQFCKLLYYRVFVFTGHLGPTPDGSDLS